jgi:hypothetical protein
VNLIEIALDLPSNLKCRHERNNTC